MKNLAISIAAAVILAGCGGGGGKNNNNDSAQATSSGVAAVGAPIVGGTVELRCASGATGTETTSATGTFSVQLPEAAYPCVARVTGGTTNGTPNLLTLHSVVLGAGNSNITTLTDLLVAKLAGEQPAAWFENVTLADLKTKVTTNTVSQAQTDLLPLLALLPGSPTLPSGFNIVTSTFNATAGDPFDALLEAYKDALEAADLTHGLVTGNIANDREVDSVNYYMLAYTYPVARAPMAMDVTPVETGVKFTVKDTARGTKTGVFTGPSTSISGDFVQVLGPEQIGQLCVLEGDGMKSLYTYRGADTVEVPLSELKGRTFSEYEDCALIATTTFENDGSITINYVDEPEETISAAVITKLFSKDGFTEPGEFSKGRAFKYFDGDGQATYFYIVGGSEVPFTEGTSFGYIMFGVEGGVSGPD